MALTRHTSLLAYFAETTPGTATTDPVNDYLPVRHDRESPDVSGLKQTAIEDPRNQQTVKGNNRIVRGLRNGTASYTIQLPGCEVVPADGAQVAETRISRLLKHAYGGQHRSNRTTISGTHSATSVQIGTDPSTLNIDEGVLVALTDTDAPDKPQLLRVTSITGSTPWTLNFDETIDFTPADGDIVHAVITIYVDEDVLIDAVANSNTFSYYMRLGRAAKEQVYQLRGCVTNNNGIELSRDDLIRATMEIMCATFDDPSEFSEPGTLANAESGAAGAPVGPRGHGFLQDYGVVTANKVHVNEIAIEPGVQSARVPTNTEIQTGMEGTATYSMARADTTVNLNLVPTADAYLSDFHNDTFKVFKWYTRRTVGKNVGFVFPRCEVAEHPSYDAAEDVLSHRLKLRAHTDTLTGGSNTQLMQSPILIALY